MNRTPFSRRDFLKRSAVAGAAVAVIQSSIARSAHAAGGDLLKIALIGCGGRGTGAGRSTGNDTETEAIFGSALLTDTTGAHPGDVQHSSLPNLTGAMFHVGHQGGSLKGTRAEPAKLVL